MINLETSEINKRVCKGCGEEKNRINNGRYPNGKDIRYIDENGKEWSGKYCPKCHKDNTAIRIKTRRHSKILY